MMNKHLEFGIFSAGISSVVLLLLFVGGSGTTGFVITTYGQELGEPFLEEQGKITDQKQIDNNTIQASYSANGTIKGDIEIMNTGDYTGILKGNDATNVQGQGTITLKDGSESASYTFTAVSSVNEEGNPIFLGSAIYSTNSTGQLAFLDNHMGIFKVEADEDGNFNGKEWEWK